MERETRRTIVFTGVEDSAKIAIKAFSNANEFWNSVSEANAAALAVAVDFYRGLYQDLIKRGVYVRALTEITTDNVGFCKELLRQGLVKELRHLDGIKGNFAVSEKEYLAVSSIVEHGPVPELIYSNDKQIVAQNQFVFNNLWSRSIPASHRIREIEEGAEQEETRVMEDLEDIMSVGNRVLSQTKDEVLMMLASGKTFLRNRGFFEMLEKRRKETGLKIRILSPDVPEEVFEIMPNFEWRRSSCEDISITMYDRKRMFLAQYANVDASPTGLAINLNIFTTNRHLIAGFASVFEALWRESEVREEAQRARHQLERSLSKEERSRKRAQLLQDILTHDIRNYNQVTKLSAELIREQLDGNREVEQLVGNMLYSIDQTSELLERAKKLGKVIAEETPNIHPVNVRDSIERSLALVRSCTPGKKIVHDLKTRDQSAAGDPFVLADDLLYEVFVNLYSNSVKYTDGDEVWIETSIDQADPDVKVPGSSSRYLKISVADRGRGIPEEIKSKAFSRYIENAKGTGLGLSIVHALTVDRYHGMVFLKDRVEGDSTRGTIVEILLPKVGPTTQDQKKREQDGSNLLSTFSKPPISK